MNFLVNLTIIVGLVLFYFFLKGSIELRQARVQNLLYGLAGIFAAWVLGTAMKLLIYPFTSMIFNDHCLPFSKDWWSYLSYFLFADFFFFSSHWLAHKIPLLWEAHKLHHDDIEVNFTSHYKHDYLYSFFIVPLFLVLIYILRLDTTKLFICTGLLGLYQLLMHSPKWVWPNWMGYFLILPQQHRVHHQIDGQRKYYGGVLSIWDRIIQTYNLRL